jgi:hypothetical protein
MTHPNPSKAVWVIGAGLIAAVLIAALYLSHSPAPPTRQAIARSISLGASANSKLAVAGTLGTLGSFDWDEAPLRTHIGIVGEIVATKLLQQAITAKEAIAIRDQLLQAKSLLDQASAMCRQDDQTGRCRGNEGKARALLDQARAVLNSISY